MFFQLNAFKILFISFLLNTVCLAIDCDLGFLNETYTDNLKDKIDTLDLRSFSRNTLNYNYSSFIEVNEADFSKMLTSNKWDSLISVMKKHNSWPYSFAAYERIRELSFFNNRNFDKLNLSDSSRLLSYVKQNLSFYDASKVEEISNEVKLRLSKVKKLSAESDIKETSAHIFALCSMYNPLLAAKCAKSLKKILSNMRPAQIDSSDFSKLYYKASISRFDLWREVFSDIDYYKATNQMSLKIIKYLNDTSLVKKSFFDDLYESFLEIGVEKTSAFRKTWNFIGFYSTRGAAIDTTVNYALQNVSELIKPMSVNLTVISAGINVLDARLLKERRHYTLPTNIIKSFDNGKPYHFWMAAFLAREEAIRSKNKKVGELTAYLASLGYQMKSKTNGRNPNRIFTIPRFAPANNKIRLDLVYGGAGARFGAYSINKLSTRKLNMDNTLRKMIKESVFLKPLSTEDSKSKWSGTGINGFLRWKKIMQPDITLKI